MTALEPGDIRLIEWPSPIGGSALHQAVVFDVRPTDARVSIVAGPTSIWVSLGELREPSVT